MDSNAQIPVEQVRLSAADLLYKYGTGGLAVSAVASSLLTFLAATGELRSQMLTWWWWMFALLAARGAHLAYWQLVVSHSSPRNGRREIFEFATGSLATAGLWSVYALVFLKDLPAGEQAVAVSILTGMAGGSTTVLAPCLWLAVTYQAVLLLPASCLFFTLRTPEHTVLGFLGFVCFATLATSARIAHHASITLLRLNLTNEELMHQREQQHQRTAEANGQLLALRTALEEANADLEKKVSDRTAKLIKEVRERERYEEELSRLATTDPLTGLRNRTWIMRQIPAALQSARGLKLAVLFIDLDAFKEVNDVRGHHAGDRVLTVVADRLVSVLGRQASLARWGGDEFVAALRDLESVEQAMQVAAALRSRISEPIAIADRSHQQRGELTATIRLDATIGISIYPDHGEGHDALIRAADLAMYAAKRQRQQRIRLYDPSLGDQAAKGHFLGQCLADAIANGELSTEFQPIVSVRERRCIAMEALVRWRHPQLGPIPPSDFIPMAERSGDILALGRWVLMDACRVAAALPGASPPAVSVNVSAMQVLEGNMVDEVRFALEQYRLPANRLHVELTETAFAGDYERVAPVLAALRDLGVKISLDDFGTGFSSLAYLRRFPIDTLKIDKAFVSGMEAESKSIVRAIVSMAGALGYDVVAEGVETEAQKADLCAIGVQHLQGYLFSKPLGEAAIGKWLANWDSQAMRSTAPQPPVVREYTGVSEYAGFAARPWPQKPWSG